MNCYLILPEETLLKGEFQRRKTVFEQRENDGLFLVRIRGRVRIEFRIQAAFEAVVV